jgi:hypothetical protein
VSVAFINKLYASLDDNGKKREWNSKPERLRSKAFWVEIKDYPRRFCEVHLIIIFVSYPSLVYSKLHLKIKVIYILGSEVSYGSRYAFTYIMDVIND